MQGNESGPSRSAWSTGPAVLLAAGAAGLWWWQTRGASWPLGLAVGLLALLAAASVVWLCRVRAARRRAAALDAYAEQELARAARRPHNASLLRKRALSRGQV